MCLFKVMVKCTLRRNNEDEQVARPTISEAAMTCHPSRLQDCGLICVYLLPLKKLCLKAFS